MPWTSDQEKAIYTRGKNIIVSAGAGSGKTAVLSERVLDYCMQGNDIRQVLVLTFTRAAALEMKERIRSKLSKNNLTEQALLIDSAYITTFDAYSLSIVKKYNYLLGVSKDISVIDSELERIKLTEIIDDIFEELYNTKDPRFYHLLDNYTTKDDEALKSNIKNIYYKLDLSLDFDSLVENYETNYLSNEFYQKVIDDYLYYFFERFNYLKKISSMLYDESSLDESLTKFNTAISSFISSLDSATEYDDICSVIKLAKLPNKPSKATEEVKSLKDLVTDALKDVQALVIAYPSVEEIKKGLVLTKDDSLTILNICDEVKRRLYKYKEELMCFSFMDIAKMAIKLVKENLEVRTYLKNYYKEILIDEYQDTSDVQEAFISLIENNNLYMVGDIKQSIYRFRNANPYIFKNKYDNYAKEIGGMKIDLKANFRSREEVLNNINLLFNTLMSDKLGDANYQEEHQMNFGLTKYKELTTDYDYNLECLTYSLKEDEVYSHDYEKAEVEAYIIAKNIKENLANHTIVYDKEANIFREIEYDDFCILIDNSKHFITFKKVFDYLNIPLTIEGDLDLKESILPGIFKNILLILSKIKDNNYDVEYKKAFTSILRSFIFELDDNQIFNIIKLNESNPYFNIFYNLASLNDISLIDLYYHICFDLDIHSKLAKIGDISNSIVVLNEIYNKFKFLNDIGYGFNEAYLFFNNMINDPSKLKYKPIQNSKNSVRVMTIHASKGLEFPFCYFPMLSNTFNKQDINATNGFDSEYGIYLPYVDEGVSQTIIGLLIKNKLLHEDLSEKVRLFYVALTRAREKMIIVNESIDKEEVLDTFSSFNQMLNQCKVYKGFSKNIELDELDLSLDYKKINSKSFEENGTLLEYSTEDTNYEVLNKKHISKSINSIIDKNLKRNLETGTMLHNVLEVIDFKNLDSLKELPISDYYKRIITKVLSNEIFKNIDKADVYKETEFYFVSDNIEYHGIIDMYAVYSDHIDIVDYKLSDTSSAEYLTQLGIYKKYISMKYNKNINVYLLSLLKNEVKKIEV